MEQIGAEPTPGLETPLLTPRRNLNSDFPELNSKQIWLRLLTATFLHFR